MLCLTPHPPLLIPFCIYMLYSQSGGHEDRGECEQKSSEQCEHLTLTYLLTEPDVPPSQSGCVCQESPVSGTAERRAAAGSLTPPSPISQVRNTKLVGERITNGHQDMLYIAYEHVHVTYCMSESRAYKKYNWSL